MGQYRFANSTDFWNLINQEALRRGRTGIPDTLRSRPPEQNGCGIKIFLWRLIRELSIDVMRCRRLRSPIGMDFCVEFYPAPAHPIGAKKKDDEIHVHDELDSRQATTDSSVASQHKTHC